MAGRGPEAVCLPASPPHPGAVSAVLGRGLLAAHGWPCCRGGWDPKEARAGSGAASNRGHPRGTWGRQARAPGCCVLGAWGVGDEHARVCEEPEGSPELSLQPGVPGRPPWLRTRDRGRKPSGPRGCPGAEQPVWPAVGLPLRQDRGALVATPLHMAGLPGGVWAQPWSPSQRMSGVGSGLGGLSLGNRGVSSEYCCCGPGQRRRWSVGAGPAPRRGPPSSRHLLPCAAGGTLTLCFPASPVPHSTPFPTSASRGHPH